MHHGSSNRLQHALSVCHHIVIVESQYSVTLGREESIALCIALDVFSLAMLSSVDLEDEQSGVTHKVDNERADRSLPPEAHAMHAVSADYVPDYPFGISHLTA
jgi:hypothetical protein